jgi:protein TonB
MSERDPKSTEKGPTVPPSVMEVIARGERDDSRMLRWAVAFAVVLHVGFFAVNWPTLAKAAPEETEERLVAVIPLHHYLPPPPRPPDQIPLPRTQRIPIPDPTPDEPEPLQREDDVREEIPYDSAEVAPYSLPPPPPEPVSQAPIIYRVGLDVAAPKKLSAPSPAYPEPARRAGLEGVVVLECRIGTTGAVSEVTVLRGAPLGMTEAAVDAVRTWRFEPAEVDGRDVEVLYVLTVSFTLGGAR